MAVCASCLICLSSSSRGAAGWFLVLGIVSPTTTAPSAALARSSTHRHKIMSDDAPANVSFKSDLTLVKGSLHAKAVFERAHACRCPLVLIAEVARGHRIIADKAVFDFVNAHQASKFIGLVSFALANDYAVRFKQAQDLVRMPSLCLEDTRLTLGDDLLNQGQVVFQSSFCGNDLQETFAAGH